MSVIVEIDPGHGLPDPGACGNGLQEHERALVLGRMVGKVLTRHGVTVFFTRTNEKSLSTATNLKQNKNQDLAKRVALSREHGAHFFLSLHMNSSGNPQSNGYETLCYSMNGQIDALHQPIKAFLQKKGIRDRGIKTRGDLAVLKGPKCKAALLECLFISNPKEAALMKDQAFLLEFAEAIAQGVLAAVGVKYVPAKAGTPTPQPKPQPVPIDPTVAAIEKLVRAGIINSPDYWLQNAKPGHKADGQYTAFLLQNMAKAVG
ncbi:Sporulation-specific N-acetylmuramoyl-L-alanine amidase [compost metagenome]